MFKHILDTVPTENFGKALEKYIRYGATLCCISIELTSCNSSGCGIGNKNSDNICLMFTMLVKYWQYAVAGKGKVINVDSKD